MITARFQGKPFNITVIQVYALNINAEEAEGEWFYEDLEDLPELTPQKEALFIIGNWKANVGSQEILMGESEELKSLLMKVKEESEKVLLKLNIQKTEIMASGPITSWQMANRWGNNGNSDRLYFGELQNHCRW